ncbi:fimbrial protein [Morganella morganii]|uniref:fimbrial protein n=2 Tax=Morganella morganii TaxID=582 RepID=UPI001BD9BA51|nr:fimbrial protein [Morganella morganii]EKT0592927.1 type 1 fimbrial protein [Morganella morganii]ELF0883785.1 type 1 fimbrial protein [Morganella morganii]MBT0389004.1 type 1 fimbrial protein [Morganella morganii subsp. morganii]MBT0396292.1 type 1 fimbrial protein [Morganella morganii subsp. morganii]MBT0517733.1 type 1 fimbrial protein [Morganella morganii subsp. morganii]
MRRYRYPVRRLITAIILGCITSAAYAGDAVLRKAGSARLTGTVISAPCSIAMKNRFQAVNITPLTLTVLSSSAVRDRYTQPFEIELRGCGSRFSSVDHKTWIIRFDGIRADNTDAFELQGPSRGLGISLSDNTRQLLTPGNNYPVHNSILRTDKSGNSLFLRYFIKPELTGMPLEAGSYQGLIRFSVNYE